MLDLSWRTCATPTRSRAPRTATNEDVGACVVRAFQRPDAARGRRFPVAGPEALTLPEVAERLGRALDRNVRFRQTTGQEYGQMMAPYLGEQLAAAIGPATTGCRPARIP